MRRSPGLDDYDSLRSRTLVVDRFQKGAQSISNTARNHFEDLKARLDHLGDEVASMQEVGTHSEFDRKRNQYFHRGDGKNRYPKQLEVDPSNSLGRLMAALKDNSQNPLPSDVLCVTAERSPAASPIKLRHASSPPPASHSKKKKILSATLLRYVRKLILKSCGLHHVLSFQRC